MVSSTGFCNISESAISKEGIRLRSEGKTIGQIAESLHMSKHSIRNWMYEYEQEADCTFECERRKYFQYRFARTSDEWLKVLQNELETTCTPFMDNFDCRVYLICGITSVKKGVDQLCMIVQERLKMNPFNGDIFAFCSLSRERIKYMSWDGGGFRIVSRRKERGKYRWPNQYIGNVIEISGNEFAFLLGHAGYSRAGNNTN
jgi:transposase